MSIGIVDIGIGNLGSLQNALHSQGWDSVMVSDPGGFEDLTHLILPGVGAFSAAVKRLKDRGLFDRIKEFAAQGRPIMGICLGMQLLAEQGTEGGENPGLGLIPGRVVPIRSQGLRLPHVGWNNAHQAQRHPRWSSKEAPGPATVIRPVCPLGTWMAWSVLAARRASLPGTFSGRASSLQPDVLGDAPARGRAGNIPACTRSGGRARVS